MINRYFDQICLASWALLTYLKLVSDQTKFYICHARVVRPTGVRVQDSPRIIVIVK